MGEVPYLHLEAVNRSLTLVKGQIEGGKNGRWSGREWHG